MLNEVLSIPLRSESPSQVFLIVLQWLLVFLQSRSDQQDPSEMYLAYDNMCSICRLKIARKPLPLPAPFDHCWLSMNKIIDKFHHKNHVDPKCKVRFSPDHLKASHPTYNTQAGEQTFTWLARFRHILCGMNKVHHLFYLHRMVRRRNKYVEKCYKLGRKPIWPHKKTK